jgi:hypothetical protein
LPLVFISPTSKTILQKKHKNIFRLPFCWFACFLVCLLEVAIMSEFVIEKSEEGKIPKVEIPSNLDSKFFVMGSGNIIGKSIIQEFFACTGLWFAMTSLFLKEPKVMPKLSLHLFLSLKEDLFALIPLCKDCFMSCLS